MARKTRAPVAPIAYNTEEAATYLGVSAETLKYWRRKGIGPDSYLMGKNRMYRVAVLDAYVAECGGGAA